MIFLIRTSHSSPGTRLIHGMKGMKDSRHRDTEVVQCKLNMDFLEDAFSGFKRPLASVTSLYLSPSLSGFQGERVSRKCRLLPCASETCSVDLESSEFEHKPETACSRTPRKHQGPAERAHTRPSRSTMKYHEVYQFFLLPCTKFLLRIKNTHI